MAATANDVITRAARRAGILAGEEALSAAEGADALTMLNDMLAGFGPKGIYYVHMFVLAATDTLVVPDEQVRNVILMFVKELADSGEYNLTLSPSLMGEIAGAKSALQACYYVAKPSITDPILRPRWARYAVWRQ